MASFQCPTLVDSCLDCVVNEFDRLSLSLNTEENHGLKHLLQLQWNDELLDKMDDALRFRHASFFMNPFLDKFDSAKFASVDFDYAEETFKNEHQDSLSSHRSKPYIPQYETSVLIRLARSLPSTLRSLRLHDVPFIDEALEIMGKTCLCLQEVSLKNCRRVTDIGTRYLWTGRETNTILKKLDVDGTSVSIEGITAILDHCPNLAELLHKKLDSAISMSYNRNISKRVLRYKIYNLKRLSIRPIYLEACLAMCPQVQNLVVYALKTKEDMDRCANFTRLKHLDIHSFQIISLSRLLEIRGADLESLKVSGSIIVPIGSLIQFGQNISSLSLCGLTLSTIAENLKDDGSHYSMPNLHNLNIYSVNLTANRQHFGVLLSYSQNIKTINFSTITDFSIECVDFITTFGLTSVVNMDIWYCDINALALKKLITATANLKNLSISMCKNLAKKQCEEMAQLNKELTVYYKTVSLVEIERMFSFV